MFRNHPHYVEIIKRQDYQFLINSKLYDFVRYVVKIQDKQDNKENN